MKFRLLTLLLTCLLASCVDYSVSNYYDVTPLADRDSPDARNWTTVMGVIESEGFRSAESDGADAHWVESPKYPTLEVTAWKRSNGIVRLAIGTGLTDRQSAARAEKSTEALERTLREKLPTGYHLISSND